MSIDLDVLTAFGSTKARLREVFTAIKDPSTDKVPKNESKDEKKERLARMRKLDRDIEVRNRFERIIQTRIIEGITYSLRSWKLYSAVDMAWDSSPITKMQIPLLMFAQGKIKVEKAADLLSKVPGGEECIKREACADGSKGKVIGIDLPKFVQTEINLIRSIISRRHAAQKNKYNQLWPYYEFEARGTSIVDKCRADVLSQRTDIMVDQYGYRHHDSQVMLDSFLYGRSLDFIQNVWDVNRQLRRKKVDGPADDTTADVVKEGLLFHAPHISRTYFDNAHPLSSINTDTGCGWIGYWDVKRFSDIEDNPYFFNKRAVAWMNGKFWGTGGIYNNFIDYFTHYNYTLLAPATGEDDPSKENDRLAQVGLYSGNMRDASVFLTNHFERIVPKDFGIGEYPYPVWTRFIVANDRSIVYAEFLPSTPCAMLAINGNDSRQVCVSMAHDLMQFQDQMTNLLTHLLSLCQIELFKVLGINTDLLTPEEVKKVRERLTNENWMEEPLVIEYSRQKMMDAGIPPTGTSQGVGPVTISETRVGQSIDTIFNAIIKLLTITNQMVAMSPAEQGQPAPREISATEVTAISTTTSSIYSSISGDIDEYRSAKKRIIYESLITCAKSEVVCPVKGRFTKATLVKAGFKTSPADDDADSVDRPKNRTVIGSTRMLVADYIFTSRDGDERPVNTQAANTLVQLISQILAVPVVAQSVRKSKLFEMFNEVFRLSGSGVDLGLEVGDGEDETLGADDMKKITQELQQMSQALQQMAGQIQNNTQEIQKLDAIEGDMKEHIGSTQQLASQVQKNAKSIQDILQTHNIKQSLVETIDYKSAPENVREAMERQAGFNVPGPRIYATPPAKTPTTKK